MRDPERDVMRLIRDHRAAVDGGDDSPNAVFFADNTLEHSRDHKHHDDGKTMAVVCWSNSLEIIQLSRDDSKDLELKYEEGSSFPKLPSYTKVKRIDIYRRSGVEALRDAAEFMLRRHESLVGDRDRAIARARQDESAREATAQDRVES